jgi:thioredoxin 1
VELHYDRSEPARRDVDALAGATVLEFGADWCGYCQAAQPLIVAVLQRYRDVRHIKVADGKGRSLGRSFAVKLWPTLIFLRDGREITRLVRPVDEQAIRDAVDAIASASS